MALALRFAARSDVGMLRSNNQDSAYAGPRLLVVADGMGGGPAGDIASSVAVEVLAALDEDAPNDPMGELARGVARANDALRDVIEERPELEGMGTTVTAILRGGSRLGLVHIGDSRAYLLSGGVLEQITRDHTFVQSLVDAGQLSPDEAEQHPQKNVIMRVLDGRHDSEPDVSVREAHDGDRYLLCSDGLPRVLSDSTIQEALAGGTPEQAAELLLELALRGGAPDNVTVIVADVVDLDTVPPGEPAVVGAAAIDSAGTARRRTGTSSAARAAALAPVAEAAVPTPARRPRWPRVLVAAAVAVAVVLGGGWLAYGWSQRQYYVGTSDGTVVIYRGLAQSIGPWHLHSVYEAQPDVPLTLLPSAFRERVLDTIGATSLTDARRIVGTLRAEADHCRAVQQATPTPPVTPSVTASPPPTRRPTTSPKPTRSATRPATPSPASTPTMTPSASTTVAPPGGCGSTP